MKETDYRAVAYSILENPEFLELTDLTDVKIGDYVEIRLGFDEIKDHPLAFQPVDSEAIYARVNSISSENGEVVRLGVILDNDPVFVKSISYGSEFTINSNQVFSKL